ncbi:MAG: hypothetical protein N2234_01970 [Planctomycetota bacterium]|nr:hypothetical protein [Planctomycetota bacterium]
MLRFLYFVFVLYISAGCATVKETRGERICESPLREVAEKVREVPQKEDVVVSQTAVEESSPKPSSFEGMDVKEEMSVSDEYKRWMSKRGEEYAKEMQKMEQMAVESRGKELSEVEKERKKAYLSDAEKLFQEGRYLDAMERYADALRLDPFDRSALEKWNECYRLSGMRVELPKIGAVGSGDGENVPPELAKRVLLLEQKFTSAEQLLREGKIEDAKKKFAEVIEMIVWEKEKIDRKGYLMKAREYLKRIEEESREKSGGYSNEGKEEKE